MGSALDLDDHALGHNLAWIKESKPIMAKRKSQQRSKAADAIAALTAQIGELIAKQNAPQPAPQAFAQQGPRVLLVRVANPVPQGGDTVQTVWKALEKGPMSYKDLENATGLSEGQVKGAVRQITLAGFLTTKSAH